MLFLPFIVEIRLIALVARAKWILETQDNEIRDDGQSC